MNFEFGKWFMNPFVLMFLSIFTGLLLGKIKFGKFSFGISGSLFSGLILGWLVTKYAQSIQSQSRIFDYAQNFLAKSVIPRDFLYLFLIIFIATVGLLAAKDIGAILKKYGIKFVILGITITMIGAIVTYGMTILTTKIFDAKTNPYEIVGTYTGAMTSSPGLAAANESAIKHAQRTVADFQSSSPQKKRKILNMIDKNLDSKNVQSLSDEQKDNYIRAAESGIGIGYAISYPFGVIIVIIAVNFFPTFFHMNVR